MQTARMSAVDTRIGRIPPSRPASRGAVVRNSHEIRPAPWATTSARIQAKTAATARAAVQPAAARARSAFLDMDPPAADPLGGGDEEDDEGEEDQAADEEGTHRGSPFGWTKVILAAAVLLLHEAGRRGRRNRTRARRIAYMNPPCSRDAR